MARIDNSSPEFLKPKLRLFMSVDLVGSTRFKQTEGNHSVWLTVVTSFYREFDRLLRDAWGHCASNFDRADFRTGEAPHFWKANGDELLYAKVLSHHSEALATLHVFIAAVREYRRNLKAKWPRLSLKATAWLAGFPVINSEVIVAAPGASVAMPGGTDPLFENMSLVDNWYRAKKKGKQGGYGLLDFVGPSIDIGFRLTAHSTEQRMAISVDLALLLAHAQFSLIKKDYSPLKIIYSGGAVLKGVLEERPYPWFWIDAREDNECNELESRLFTSEVHRIKEYCEDFLGHSTHPAIVRPYIISADESTFHIIPDNHEDLRAKLLNHWLGQREILKAEKLAEADPLSSRPSSEGYVLLLSKLPS